MLKIDRSELLRCFVILEILFVWIPIAFCGLIFGFLVLVVGFELELLNLCGVILLALYLSLPSLIFSAIFEDSVLGSISNSAMSWILAIVIYSVIAFLVALVFSLYTPLNKQDESGQKSTKHS